MKLKRAKEMTLLAIVNNVNLQFTDDYEMDIEAIKMLCQWKLKYDKLELYNEWFKELMSVENGHRLYKLIGRRFIGKGIQTPTMLTIEEVKYWINYWTTSLGLERFNDFTVLNNEISFMNKTINSYRLEEFLK